MSVSSLSDVDSPSHSSPEVELSSLGQAGKSAPGLNDDADSDSDDADLDVGLDLGDDEDDIPLQHQHPAISAKSVPSKQPRPVDVLSQRNGSAHAASKKAPQAAGDGRPVVGGKGRRGEEALEHAVAAREEVERRRVEMGMQSTQAAKSVPGSAAALAAKATLAKADAELQEKEDETVRVKQEDDEVVIVPALEEDDSTPVRRDFIKV